MKTKFYPLERGDFILLGQWRGKLNQFTSSLSSLRKKNSQIKVYVESKMIEQHKNTQQSMVTLREELYMLGLG